MARPQAPISLTKEEVKQAGKEVFELRFEEWIEKHWQNPDSYEYEKTFDLMLKACMQELMQLTSGPVPKDKNLKKN